MTGFLNGIQVFSVGYNHGNGLSNTQPLIIGGRNDQSTVGLFDDLGIFDSSLTVGEARPSTTSPPPSKATTTSAMSTS